MDLDKYIVICIYFNIIESIFTDSVLWLFIALHSPCKPLIILLSPKFCLFQNVIFLEIVQYEAFSNFLFSLCGMHLNFIHVFADHVIFIPYSVNMVYHIDWFVCVEPSLYSRDKSHSLMVYDPFIVLLNSAC